MDRGFTHGDVVASVDAPLESTGTVVDVRLAIDAKLLRSGQRVKGVPAAFLSDIHPFMLGRHVARKEPPILIGTIDEVYYNVEVRLPDESRCIVHDVLFENGFSFRFPGISQDTENSRR